MNIALIGATGFIGSAILTEALNRGHRVTAVVRNIEKLPQHVNLTAKAADVTDEAQAAALFAGQEAVVSSFAPRGEADQYAGFLDSYRTIISAVKQAGVKRLLVVGGAGSLEVNGVQVVDGGGIPEEWKSGVLGLREVLYTLRKETDLDWTFLSPSAVIEPGERTGKFRLGRDDLLVAEDGKSHISVADYAVAMIDELEKPAHSRQRFTVGY
ncbi:MAG: 3-beta hydroxysteroid dehydrogenase [Chloroflexi bacterium HGW-Chloroflexi-4]|nr:MAG: 3-beta hydroxysteroid dehydrogenase [Chloroflexi bacterium HGW-Chloroflexi-4]